MLLTFGAMGVLAGVVVLLCGRAEVQADEAMVDKTVAAIRAAALAPNVSDKGRPLPLAAHWHRRSMPPSWQIEQIQAGHHLLPWVSYQRRDKGDQLEADLPAIRQIAQWRLPLLLLTGSQWEQEFYRSPEYINAPADETGVAVALSGKKIKALSPFSPVQPWRDLGRKWTDNAVIDALEEVYPDPPRVIFVSNNEANKMRWHKAESMQRYMDEYGEGRSDDFKRQVFGDGWIERYGALLAGMRDGLDNSTWRQNSRFVPYGAFGPDHFARWEDWPQYSLHTEDRIAWGWYAWDGAISESYDNHWEPLKRAYNVWSMQTEMMNLVFMRQEALKVNPDYWHEVILWDGYLPEKDNNKRGQYEKDGHAYTTELYRGWTQYVMWTLTPRVAREWRGSAFDKENWQPYFDEIVEAVDLVHADAVLARFWRQGELVPNRSREHPFHTGVPEKWRDVDRWFHLNTNLDPQSMAFDQKMPVYTLARVIGERGSREWLVYAHGTMGAQLGVRVTIPDYDTITIDVPVAGSFHHVKEADKSITRVGTAFD